MILHDAVSISSTTISGLVLGATIDVASSTTAPSLSMTAGYSYAITGSTSAPSLSCTLVNIYPIDIVATTRTPNVDITLSIEKLYNITASTRSPSLVCELYNNSNISITASTRPPQLVLNILASNEYSIIATTARPSLIATFLGFSPTIPPNISAASDETTAWCVNLTTGGHTRYTNYPDADTISLIEAKLVTASMDFGILTVKHVSDIFMSSRATDCNMLIDLLIDEHILRTDYRVSSNDSLGVHRRRCKIPKGLRGTSWQITYKNDSGYYIEVLSSEIIIHPTVRHQ